MRPRTDRSELEKYHEGLIICSACLGGEIPKRITAGQFAEAEEAIQPFVAGAPSKERNERQQ